MVVGLGWVELGMLSFISMPPIPPPPPHTQIKAAADLAHVDAALLKVPGRRGGRLGVMVGAIVMAGREAGCILPS